MADASRHKWGLIVMFSMTFVDFLVELVVGYYCGSMALVSDSFHMLSDVVALSVAFISVKISSKVWPNNTFGWARAEVLGALVNSVFLSALCFSIFVESIQRCVVTEEIKEPKLLLYVAVAGLLINLIGLLMFHEGHGHSHNHNHRPTIHNQNRVTRIVNMTGNDDAYNDQTISTDENLNAQQMDTVNNELETSNNDSAQISVPIVIDDLVDTEHSIHSHSHSKPKEKGSINIRGVFLHILADTLGSIVVVVSACVAIWTKWEYAVYIDPALSLIMVVLILVATIPLLKESSLILLQSVPTHIQIDALKRKFLLEVEGVIDIHEFHIWQLSGNKIIATAHIRCRNLVDYMSISEKVKEFFHNEGIHSTTIQAEFLEHYPDARTTQNCFLECPPETGCATNTCCGPPTTQ